MDENVVPPVAQEEESEPRVRQRGSIWRLIGAEGAWSSALESLGLGSERRRKGGWGISRDRS